MLDGLETVSICDRYEPGPDGEDMPVYRQVPGWQQSTVGTRKLEDLPKQARSYLDVIESACEVTIDFVSTGPDREDTIVVRNPFDP